MDEKRRVFEVYGFTNDPGELAKVVEFRRLAVADGWTYEPTYRTESQERASKHHREGFTMQVLARDNFGPTYQYEAKVSIWCPLGIAVEVPPNYDFAAIKANTEKCGECGKTGVQTQRVAFANRVCNECIPAAKAKHERPGWNN